MNPIISIIIPVYNTEKYLKNCIESLQVQTLQKCEFIFIDDGSTDNSYDLIESYSKKDNRIILIKQNNKGVSEARNKGISIAKGKYIGFVDSDDYIKKDMYDQLYKNINDVDCDVIISNFEGEFKQDIYIHKYDFPKNKILNKNYIENTIIPFLISSDSLNTVCNKLYRKSIIEKNNIKFPKGLPLGEDGIFNMIFFSNANSCKYIDYTGYHYREVEGSATRNLEKNNYFQRELDIYNFDLSKFINIPSNLDIEVLKSIKLINNIRSNIYVFFNESKSMNIIYKCKYIKNIIKNKDISSAQKIYIKNIEITSIYNKLFMFSMKKHLSILLYILCKYSKIRNK